jgi:hypothetical protein
VLLGIGFFGPLLGLLVFASEVGLSPAHAGLYLAGLSTIGYVAWTSVLFALVWAAVAAQLTALVLGRYAPYAGGAEPPPPGPLRTGVARLARNLRGRQPSAR